MRSAICFIISVTSIIILTSCGSRSDQKTANAKHTETAAAINRNTPIDIVAQDFKFQVPDTLPSGWVNIHFINKGKQTHFFMLNKLPDGITYEDYLNEIAPPFGKVWKALKDSGISKQEASNRLMATLPKWVADVRTMGGSGLIAPGGTADIVLKLIPGDYEMECYVKTPEGVFHEALGMVNHVIVSENSTNLTPPQADVHLTLQNHKIESNESLTAGKHTVAVHFKDPAPFGVGDDIHLVKLDETTDLNGVIEWMNWMNVHGLEAPSPATFLGGVQEMPQGSTEYFTVDLKPGRYAWIAESYASAGMVQQFSVE